MEKIKVIVDYTDKNYSAMTADVGGVVIVTDRTLEGLEKSFKESFEFHIEGCLSDGDDLPEWVVNGDYEIEYEYSTSALLQKFDGVLTRSALSRVTGINERQLGHYATGHRKPRKEQREKIIKGFHKLAKEFQEVV